MAAYKNYNEEYSMNLEQAVKDYENNIKKLATKNNVDFEVMLENWEKKFEEFDNITNRYGFEEDLDQFAKDEAKPFIALTINGSIVIASELDDNGLRKVRYQSIKIRTDDSKNVPKIFNASVKDDIELKKAIVFEKTIETSFIIRIKSSENFNWDDFEETADVITQEFTRKFELIDQETITKQLEEFE